MMNSSNVKKIIMYDYVCIDLIPILDGLFMDKESFLNPIRKVEIRYEQKTQELADPEGDPEGRKVYQLNDNRITHSSSARMHGRCCCVNNIRMAANSK